MLRRLTRTMPFMPGLPFVLLQHPVAVAVQAFEVSNQVGDFQDAILVGIEHSHQHVAM